jgi:hypothetical protein
MRKGKTERMSKGKTEIEKIKTVNTVRMRYLKTERMRNGKTETE